MQPRKLAAVLDEILDRPSVNGVRLVGVDGPSGSGKSTLARRLAELAAAPVLAIDDFVSWGDLHSWWDRFEQEALEPLSRGTDARYRVRDWHNDEFGASLNGWAAVVAVPLVVVEGVTCTRAAAVQRFAYRIWVDAAADVRLGRGVERDGESHRQLWLDWMALEQEFFAEDRTRSRADLVVEGDPPVTHGPDEVMVAAG